MRPPRLVVFDCEGTLADVHHTAVEAMRLAFKAQGLPCPPRAEILKTTHLFAFEAIEFLTPFLAFETRERIALAYCDWLRTLSLRPQGSEAIFEGAAPFLSAIASEDEILLGIATGKSRRGLMRFLRGNGLEELFATLQTADHAPSKPHPAMLMRAMEEAGALPKDTVMIGDTPADMMMAVNAGVPPIGVSWGHGKEAELRGAGAVAVVHSFGELRRLLSMPARQDGAHQAVVAA